LLALVLTGCAESIRQEPDALLRQDIDVLRKDVDELKKLLEPKKARPPEPVAKAVEGVLEIGNAPVKGNPDAKITVMEFSDYQCPFCKRYADATFSKIDQEYISTGKIRYVFRDFPLAMHKQANKAAEAAHCAAEQGKYWEMHDRLFANQQALSDKELLAHGRTLGLKGKAFKSCLNSGKYAEQIETDIAEGKKLGISGTPSVLLGISDGKRIKNIKILRGAHPFATFKQEIEKLMNSKDDKAAKP